ncbi:MAG: hypothetical protein AB8I80_24790, partial [Anaerolineae bacterium]
MSILILVARVAVGCSQTPAPTATTGATEPTATPQASAPTAVPVDGASASGQIQLAGSTTVQPLAEVLAEAFMAENPGVTIDVQGGGS